MPVKDPKEKISRTVYRILKRQIVTGVLTSESPITETSLAGEFGCSQGTIREALLSLQDDGLVVRRGYHGTYVTEINEEEASVLMKLRQEIEMAGVVHAVDRITSADIAELYEANEKLDESRAAGDDFVASEYNRIWHERLFAVAKLPLLEPALKRIIIQQSRVMLHIAQDPGIHESPEDATHADILEALERRDETAARNAMALHIADNAPLLAPYARRDYLSSLEAADKRQIAAAPPLP